MTVYVCFQGYDEALVKQWLINERLPHFYSSDLAFEFTLCKKLLTTTLHITLNSYRGRNGKCIVNMYYICTCVTS